ncbi:MAG: ATP-binding protein [Lentisphaerae bacterium]|jgi:hypothetical protein|nr:ATP-binding protein [Lentisphaerota bacterium]MBT5610516.1 ATP-binding protein [Lentisphaerota bacterium]MBT7056071.1 ATP-binding protein [Lentisphaerota bacterium]MBT7842428.1 ATP-binding protein [Lentisphaerota bacterium]
MPFVGRDKATRWWRAYQMEDAQGRKDIETAIQFRLEQALGVTPLSLDHGLSVPQQAEADGPYRIGTVMGGDRSFYPFGLRDDELIQHMAIFGRSGAGKTNTVALFLRRLAAQGKPFLIFDWKRNYRDLLSGPEPLPLDVYTVGTHVHPLRFNPLIPPFGTDITVWLKKLIEIVSNAYYLGEGVMFILQEALDHVYKEAGCYDNRDAQFPTMADVLEFVRNMSAKGRKAMWLDSTIRAVQSLCFGQISDVINVSSNDSIGDLLDRNACLELHSLAHAEKIFLIETLLVWVHHFRLLEPDRETFKHCILVEEAHNILSASNKETVIDLLLREIRELGEGIVLIDQHPSQISVPALGNTYCTIALNIKHPKDINTLGEIMHIPREQRDVLGQLAMGRAIVKLQSRFVQPFQVSIPKVDIAKGSVTDTHLMQLYPPDITDSGPESPVCAGEPPILPLPPDPKHGVDRMESADADKPSEVEMLLLQDVRDHPLDGVVKRYARIGVSRRRGNRAKQSLIDRGLLVTVDVPTRTGKVVLLDFSEKMKTALRRSGKLNSTPREGGLAHAYWKQQITDGLVSHGWSVRPEEPIGGGQAVDLHAEKKGFRVAVEVEIGRRGAANIAKLLKQGYDWLISFAADEGVKATTLRGLQAKGIHSSRVLLTIPADIEKKLAFVTARASERSDD